MSIVIVSPIARPAIDLNVPRGSTALANTTHARKNVITASSPNAAPGETPLPTAGTPRLTASVWPEGISSLTSSAASAAAASWEHQYSTATGGLIRRVTSSPKVIAGLKCAPEMCPSAETITAIARPWARATPISEGSCTWLAATIAPMPMNSRVNVPTNSATPLRRESSGIGGDCRQQGGRTAPSPSGPGSPRAAGGSAYTPEGAPPGHLLAEPDSVAVADVPVLLQVLRLRHPPGSPLRPRRGDRDPRWGRPQAGEGAARPDRRAPGGEPGGGRAAEGLWARGLHRLRGVGVRAGAREGAAAAHQPRRPLPSGSRTAAGGDRLPGADARVGVRAADGDRSRGLPDQASGAPAGDDPLRRRAADPLHQRHPRGDRGDRAGADAVAGGARRRARRPRPHPGGDHPELRPPPALLRSGAGRDRRRGRTGVLAHRRQRRVPEGAAEAPAAGVGGGGRRPCRDRGHEAADRGGPTADARRGDTGPPQPR